MQYNLSFHFTQLSGNSNINQMETSWTAAQLNRVLQARFGADRAGKFATADPTPRYKIVTLGDAGAGKSCLVRRYCERKFTASYIATIGIDYGLKAVALGPDHTVKINFWDMAGDRAYAVIRNEFYNDVHGIMLVIDVTHKDAAAHARKWMDEIRSRVVSLSTTPIVLAVNKVSHLSYVSLKCLDCSRENAHRSTSPTVPSHRSR
ncbi:P-loop containing nucleoside triphosphate hydrolase protein [Blastocladiella britannica]|nr:P-loop containing nucleoside triphosphate hydrolase protein [Blastocladiella britannica]